MTRVMTGRPCRTHISEALSRLFLGTPAGWTLCGFIGLCVMVNPWMKSVTVGLDSIMREPCHCEEAVSRSIERASHEPR